MRRQLVLLLFGQALMACVGSTSSCGGGGGAWKQGTGWGREAPPDPEEEARNAPDQSEIDFVGVVRVRDLSACVMVGPGDGVAKQCDGSIGNLWDVEVEKTLWGESPREFLLAVKAGQGEVSERRRAAYMEYTEGRERKLLVASRRNSSPAVRSVGLTVPPAICGKEVAGTLSEVAWGVMFHPDGSGQVGHVDALDWKEGHENIGMIGRQWIASADASDRWMDGARLMELLAKRYVEPIPKADPNTPSWDMMDEIVVGRSWYILSTGGLCVPHRVTGEPELCGVTGGDCETRPFPSP